ncbi:transcriptional regulator [Motiliproteus sp. MSK22-1]|nr:metalloregulator ArsR/SmtB family transcription factor [Motiliproteus sp. MSK22-1]OMH30434.1 transcriptional regulator [Motiliproteus sp. MSK22-1]
MEIDEAAKALKELGHPTRLLIYKKVVKAGLPGIPVGSIQEQLEIPGSTLSHHISSLASAGLIFQRRESRTLYCVAEYQCLADVIRFLQDECCHDDFDNPIRCPDIECDIPDQS